jgi:hypothetical protein
MIRGETCLNRDRKGQPSSIRTPHLEFYELTLQLIAPLFGKYVCYTPAIIPNFQAIKVTAHPFDHFLWRK